MKFLLFLPDIHQHQKVEKNEVKIPKYEISRKTLIGSGAAPCGQTDRLRNMAR
jgi:hypothetical protein